MRKKRAIFCFLLCLLLVLGMSASAFAEPYTYTITVYAGRQGSFTIGDDPKVYTVTGLQYGDIFRFDYQNAVQLPAGSKYEVRGIRESGQDNNTVSASAFYVTRDQEYVVAYRIPSNRVSYNVYFRESGTERELIPPEQYYGNDGDEVINAFPYIDGYRPAALNGRWTLHEGQENDRVFYYTAIPVPTAAPAPAAQQTGTTTPTPEPTEEPEEESEENLEAPHEEPEPTEMPQPVIEPETPPEPETSPPIEEILDLEGPRAAFTWKHPGEEGYETQMLWVGIGAGFLTVLALGISLYLLARKRRKEKEKERTEN